MAQAAQQVNRSADGRYASLARSESSTDLDIGLGTSLLDPTYFEGKVEAETLLSGTRFPRARAGFVSQFLAVADLVENHATSSRTLARHCRVLIAAAASDQEEMLAERAIRGSGFRQPLEKELLIACAGARRDGGLPVQEHPDYPLDSLCDHPSVEPRPVMEPRHVDTGALTAAYSAGLTTTDVRAIFRRHCESAADHEAFVAGRPPTLPIEQALALAETESAAEDAAALSRVRLGPTTRLNIEADLRQAAHRASIGWPRETWGEEQTFGVNDLANIADFEAGSDPSSPVRHRGSGVLLVRAFVPTSSDRPIPEAEILGRVVTESVVESGPGRRPRHAVTGQWLITTKESAASACLKVEPLLQRHVWIETWKRPIEQEDDR